MPLISFSPRFTDCLKELRGFTGSSLQKSKNNNNKKGISWHEEMLGL